MEFSKKRSLPKNNKKECKCNVHEYLTHFKPFKRIYSISGKEIKKAGIIYLQSENLLGKEASYVCDVCLQYGEDKTIRSKEYEKSLDEVKKTMFVESLHYLIENITSPLENDTIKMLEHLFFQISRTFVEPAITQHYKELSGQYKNVNHLQNLNSSDFLESISPFIMAFLNGSSGKTFSLIQDPKVLFRMAVVVETIYHINNSNAVLPHCFIMNLAQKQISGSKNVAVINGKILPGGSDTVLQEWWEVQGSNPLIILHLLMLLFNSIMLANILCHHSGLKVNATPRPLLSLRPNVYH